ncbi:MAG: alpha/beta fold hydrolase [Burkholderiales bacterium]|nr:alpha/beta fold hydrolase [Burkholderiales bacterium]
MKATVVLLHGFASSGQTWSRLAQDLATDFSVLAPDWPGFGRSSRRAPLRSAAQMAQAVLGHADALGADRIHVLGHSMSGFVVQELLAAHADRLGRVVLYGAGARVDQGRRFEPIERTVERLLADGVASTVERVAATWFCAGEGDPAFAACVADGRRMSRAAAVAAMRAFASADYRGRLGRAGAECLVIMGERDRTFPVDLGVELRDALPRAQLCVLPGCAHAAHLERPDLFGAIVGAFLREGLAAR